MLQHERSSLYMPGMTLPHGIHQDKPQEQTQHPFPITLDDTAILATTARNNLPVQLFATPVSVTDQRTATGFESHTRLQSHKDRSVEISRQTRVCC